MLGTTCNACVPHARLKLSLHSSQLREAFQGRQGLRTLQVQLTNPTCGSNLCRTSEAQLLRLRTLQVLLSSQHEGAARHKAQ